MVELWTHCRRKPDRPAWATVVGFTNVSWLGDDGHPSDTCPRVGERHLVDVRAPFVAESVFFALWMPALASVNGWDSSTAARLHEMRVVSCRLVSSIPIDARAADGPSCAHATERTDPLPTSARLEVEVVALFDPMDLLEANQPVASDLEGFLLGREHRRSELVHDDRRWVETSMQSDVNFGYLLTADERRVVLVVDESICSGFFYAGHAALKPLALRTLASVAADRP